MRRLTAVAAAVLLAGCATTDPYSGQQKTSNTGKGAGYGALAGAVLGALARDGDRKKGALYGAAMGAAIGGGVGKYMDNQEAVLRQELQGAGVGVVREGDNIRLVMPSNITFDVDRADVQASFYPTLKSVAHVINKYDQTDVRIYGHTDSTGRADYNQRLSERRAAGVSQFLMSQGVASDRLFATGYGSRYPVASNDAGAGRQQNRRVEIELQAIEH